MGIWSGHPESQKEREEGEGEGEDGGSRSLRERERRVRKALHFPTFFPKFHKFEVQPSLRALSELRIPRLN